MIWQQLVGYSVRTAQPKIIVFTGALESMSRRAAFQRVYDVGGTPGDTVTKETNVACIGPVTGGRPWVDAWAARPAAGRYGVTVTTENMPALKWPGMLQTKR
jgi:NAD-dependent DNA ligase